MKTKNKALTLAICAVLLVAVSIMGTIAYLTSTANVVNTFTVGDVRITLDETDVDEYGVKDSENRVVSNQYKLVPGHTYVKDPTVTVVKGSEEAYVRMIVTITNAAAVKEAFGDDFLPQNYVDGWDSAVWTCVNATEDTANNALVYEFRYHEVVDARDVSEDVKLEALFTEFTLDGDVTRDELQKLQSGFAINVEGHAIQATGFADADAAWAAFTK